MVRSTMWGMKLHEVAVVAGATAAMLHQLLVILLLGGGTVDGDGAADR